METITNRLDRMALDNQPVAPILEPPVIHEIFVNDADVLSAGRETRHVILEVPNIRCGRYYDDEDFIYARMRFNDSPDSPDSLDIPTPSCPHPCQVDYLAYMMEHNLIISCQELDLNPPAVMAKILYINQHTSAYYTSLRHLRPVERLVYLPADFMVWIANATDTVRTLLDKGIMRYVVNEPGNGGIPETKFNEMIYGLGLITCHIRVICNHYGNGTRNMDGNVSKLVDMEEGHMKKLMRLANNMCVVMMYLWMSL